jgi:hypothetical protein
MRKAENTGIWKNQIALFGELAVEEAMNCDISD